MKIGRFLTELFAKGDVFKVHRIHMYCMGLIKRSNICHQRNESFIASWFWWCHIGLSLVIVQYSAESSTTSGFQL